MIVAENVQARVQDREGRSTIKNVTFTWERGLLAVLGSPMDGTAAFAYAIAGAADIRAGRLHIQGKPSAASPLCVTYVPRDAVLPDGLRVEEVCELSRAIRREPARTPVSRLAVLGLESLARRRVRSLSVGESKAVSLAIAITSSAPVLVVDEPLAGLDPVAPARVIEALRKRAETTAVIVTTASVRDATRLGDQLAVLTNGVFSHLPPALAHVDRSGAKLRVTVRADGAAGVARFLGAISHEPAISSLEVTSFASESVSRAPHIVLVGGRDLLPLARSVARAASSSGASIVAIESDVVALETLRQSLVLPVAAPLASVATIPARPVALPGDVP